MATYSNSNEWLTRVQRTIPTGSQTFSKSHYSLPEGGAPLFIERGDGAYAWDIDGNKFVDLVNGLLCVSLGYQDPDVDNAIKMQLKKGITFSLPSLLEGELAERLVDLIPSAEMVRFGKNGTDVTSAAIRLARAYTGKNRVAVCGYHGWQDWYIGSTSRSLGVPESTQLLTSSFTYNDIASLEQLMADHANEFAAIILEPMSLVEPVDDFLQQVRNIADKESVVLIFDEMITGFRLALGGAQQKFGVTPDLSTFGKGMANGLPLSAIVGRQELMILMEDIFFSGTFGGETLSLAGAIACLEKLESKNVPDSFERYGNLLSESVNGHLRQNNIQWLELVGHPSWKFFSVNGHNEQHNLELKSLLIERLCREGILTLGTLNLSYATTLLPLEEISQRIITAIEYADDHIDDPVSVMNGKPIKPVFHVRGK